MVLTKVVLEGPKCKWLAVVWKIKWEKDILVVFLFCPFFLGFFFYASSACKIAD